MKIVKLACLSLGMVVLMSCRDERTTTRTPDNLDDNTVQRTDREIDRIDNTGQTQNQTHREGRVDNTALFTQLNMTPDQIQRYETREREFLQGRTEAQVTNETHAERTRRRTDNLREILNEDQFRRYEEWQRNNPNQ